MKISELISALQTFKKANGDLTIAIAPEDDEGYLYRTHNLRLDLLCIQLAPAHKPWKDYHVFRQYTDGSIKTTHVEFKLS